MRLSIKQENFCNYYIECGNASESYRRAYSCKNMKDNTVNRKAIEAFRIMGEETRFDIPTDVLGKAREIFERELNSDQFK